MKAILIAEWRKLKGSLALALLFVAPLFPATIVLLATATAGRTMLWGEIFAGFALPLWAVFVLPMAMTAVATLMSQLEYGASGWDHLLALPVPRSQIFLAKSIIAVTATWAMTALAIVFVLFAARIGGWMSGFPPSGAIGFSALAQSAGMLSASATFLVAIQLWVSLRFANFVVGLSAGIGGAMVGLAVAMTGTDQADWFPWVLPVKAIMTTDPIPFAALGLAGGAFTVAAMTIDLSRRSFR